MGKGDTPLATTVTRSDAASPVTHGQLNSRLDKFGTELTNKLQKLIDLAVSSSVNDLKDSFEDIKVEIANSKSDFQEFVKLSMETVEALNARIKYLETSALYQTLWNNSKEQRGRSKSFRLHNHKSSAIDAPSSMIDTYEFLVLPAFTRAKQHGDINHIPEMSACLEYGHPLRAKSPGDIPAVICKMTSRYLFGIFIKHGRAVVEEMNKTRGSLERVRLGKDLTYLNRRAMTFICNHNQTDKVRISGSSVQYTMKADPEVWLQIENPAADCLADMRLVVECPLLAKLKEVKAVNEVVVEVHQVEGEVDAPVVADHVATD